jgi:hypothetical protein
MKTQNPIKKVNLIVTDFNNELLNYLKENNILFNPITEKNHFGQEINFFGTEKSLKKLILDFWGDEDFINDIESLKNDCEIYSTFVIDGKIQNTIDELYHAKLFIDYLYNKCNLRGIFHCDDEFKSYFIYVDKNPIRQIFTDAQCKIYEKYLADIFKLDFTPYKYDDFYNFCLNFDADSCDFLAYQSDDKINIGVRSNFKFNADLEYMGNNEFVHYIKLKKGQDGNFPQYNLTAVWNKNICFVSALNGFEETIIFED